MIATLSMLAKLTLIVWAPCIVAIIWFVIGRSRKKKGKVVKMDNYEPLEEQLN